MEPERHEERVVAFAEDLIQCMAMHLAETVAGLFQDALQDASRGLVDSNNAPLLSPKFWLQPIYTELLNAGSRFRAIKAKEIRRPATSLVKVMCVPYAGLAAASHRGKRKVDTSRVSLLGVINAGQAVCWFGFLPPGCHWSWKLFMPRTLRRRRTRTLLSLMRHSFPTALDLN